MTDSFEKCILFKGLAGERLTHALEYFHAFPRSYRKGEFVHRVGEPLTRFGLVLSGGVQVYMDDFDGHSMIMANVEPGGTFGEALAFLGREPQIYICASSDTEIMWMQIPDFCSPTADRLLVSRFITLFAERTLQMNDRIQLLSKLTLRAKLTVFLSQQAAAAGSRTFTVPFNRNDMAAYLGSDRSALSRELSRMKAEGLISYRGNKFTVK